MPVKKNLLYTGKAKSMYETDDPNLLITDFRDDTTAFDGAKHEKLARKGMVNNQISAYLMTVLRDHGVPTHFEQLLSPHEVLVKRLQMIPLECVVRNMAAGSLTRRLGIELATPLQPPLYELFLKNDVLHDPMISEHHALSFGWATLEQLKQMQHWSLKINEILKELFDQHDLILVDAKYEFGCFNHDIYLGDEISPDSCRIWDKKTKESLDKDRFRKDLGNVVESYEIIAKRLGVVIH